MPASCDPLRPPAIPRPRRDAGTLIVAVALALACAPAAGAVYKWVDANGRVVYSDQPPPASVKSETLKDLPPPANPNAAKELEEQEFARKQAEKKKQEAAAAAEKTRAETEQKRDMCATARGQLAMLLDARQPVFRFNDKGERVAFDDQMRRDEIERTQRLIRDSCRN
jgi:hypothetical protein